MQQRSIVVGTLCAVALSAVAACTSESPKEAAESASGADAARLIDMVNENARLEAELRGAEKRIIRSCLEGEGFDTHDEVELSVPEPEERADFSEGFYPHSIFMPAPDLAGEYGFGMWAQAEEGFDSPAAEAYNEATAELVEGPAGIDNAAFEGMSEQDRRAWYVAYVGEERAEADFAWKFVTDGEILSGEGEPLPGGGDLDFDAAEPGGCEREMIDALYGDLAQVDRTVETEEGNETETLWVYGPASPDADGAVWVAADAAYAEDVAGVQDAFVDCLDGLGQVGWGFDEAGGLPTFEFFGNLYNGTDQSPASGEIPDPPAGLAGFEDAKAFEIEVAQDFLECDEQVGYTAASVEAWDQGLAEGYAGIEEQAYAWQEEMRAAIGRAQELLGA